MTWVSLSVLLHVCVCACVCAYVSIHWYHNGLAYCYMCVSNVVLLNNLDNMSNVAVVTLLLREFFFLFHCYCTMHPVWLQLHPVKLESMMSVSDTGPMSHCGFLPPLPFVEPLFHYFILYVKIHMRHYLVYAGKLILVSVHTWMWDFTMWLLLLSHMIHLCWCWCMHYCFLYFKWQ